MTEKKEYRVGALNSDISSLPTLIKWEQLGLENGILKTEKGNNTKIQVYDLLDVEGLKDSDLIIAGYTPVDINVVKELRKTNKIARYTCLINSRSKLVDAVNNGYFLDIPFESFGSQGLMKLLKSDDFFESLKKNDEEALYNSVRDINEKLCSEEDKIITLYNPKRGMPRQPAVFGR